VTASFSKTEVGIKGRRSDTIITITKGSYAAISKFKTQSDSKASNNGIISGLAEVTRNFFEGNSR
jgi:hypothetical protein